MKDEREIFISYHSSELNLARRIIKILEDEGVSVWWDEGERDNPAYATVSEILLHLMEPLLINSKYLLVIATGGAFASDWVPFEVSSFLESKNPVIVWHPSDDEFNPLPFRPNMKEDSYKEIINIFEHEDIIAHYELSRQEVDLVAKNIAFLIRFFRFVEGKGKKVNRLSLSCYWEDYMGFIRSKVDN